MVTALALMIATHELVPFTVAILAVASTLEIAACLGHLLSLRAVPAIAADFAVWLLVYLMTSASGVPDGYQPTAPLTLIAVWVALVLTYVGSIGIRTFWLGRPIAVVDILQGTLAFMIAIFSAARSTMDLITPLLGAFFLVLAGGCYWGALSRFANQLYVRNHRASSTWAAILLIAGAFLLFPTTIQVLFLCLAAVAVTFVYTRTSKISVGLHATLFLAAGAVASPLPQYAMNALAGIVPAAPDWGVWAMAGSAMTCYLIGAQTPELIARRRALWIFPAALLGSAATAVAVAAIVWLALGRLELSASRLSVIRTVVICVVALSSGFISRRWRRSELGWVAYAAVALGTLKLLFEDLRFGNAASLVISLLFYGLVLIMLPRLTHRAPTDSFHAKGYSVSS
jgi:hypothetical protein